MKNIEIANQVYCYLMDKFDYAKDLTAGELRNFSGLIVEDMIDLIFEECAKNHENVDGKIYIGNSVPVVITDPQGYSIKESVDKHIFINGELVCAIECKTYLDKCYMQRADSDFNLMTSYGKTFDTVIVSLENGIADNSYNFFLNRGNIDRVFYLATGKRNSARDKRIYNNPDRINHSLILDLVDYIDSLFER